MVGLEGVGHHGIHPALVRIIQASRHICLGPHDCGSNGEQGELIHSFLTGRAKEFRQKLAIRNNFVKENTSAIFWASFPAGVYDRQRTGENLNGLPHMYDLNSFTETVIGMNNVEGSIPVKLKFLYMFRQTFSMINSHVLNELMFSETATFASHADVLSRYHGVLNLLFQKTNPKLPNLWAAIHSEWFLVPEQCETLVTGIVNFFEWDVIHVNVSKACERINAAMATNTFTKHEINCTHYNSSLGMNFTMPSIPLIEGNFVMPEHTSTFSAMKQCT